MMATAALVHADGWVYEPYNAGWGKHPCSSSRLNPPV